MVGMALFVCAVVGALRIATLTIRGTKRLAARIGAALKSARKSIKRALNRKPKAPGINLSDKQLLAMALQLAHEALKQRGQAIPEVASWRQAPTSKAMVRS